MSQNIGIKWGFSDRLRNLFLIYSHDKDENDENKEKESKEKLSFFSFHEKTQILSVKQKIKMFSERDCRWFFFQVILHLKGGTPD